MTSICASVLCCALLTQVQADLKIHELRKDQVGRIPHPRAAFDGAIIVSRVIKSGEVIVVYRMGGIGVPRSDREYVLAVKGIDTSDMVTDRATYLPGIYKVDGTANFGGSTIFVLSYVEQKTDPKEDARKAEQEAARAKEEKRVGDALRKAAAEIEAKRAAKEAIVKREDAAARKLTIAKSQHASGAELVASGKTKEGQANIEFARNRLREIVRDFEGTEAAKEAAGLLVKWK